MKFTNRITLTPAARLMTITFFVALAGLASTLAQAQPMGGRHGGPGGRDGAIAGPFGGQMMERLLDNVDATTEQRNRIREIAKAAAADLRAQQDSRRALREQAMTLFTQPTVDARAAEALRQQMLQQHDLTSRRWMQAMLDASAVLSAEQRAKLAERMKQRRELMERHQRERRALDAPKS